MVSNVDNEYGKIKVMKKSYYKIEENINIKKYGENDIELIDKNIEKLNLIEKEREEIIKLLFICFDTNNINENRIIKNYVNIYHSLKNDNLSINDEMGRTLTLILLNILICYKKPKISKRDNYMIKTWYDVCIPIIEKLKKLHKVVQTTNNTNSDVLIIKHNKFIEVTFILYFYCIKSIIKNRAFNNSRKNYDKCLLKHCLYCIEEIIKLYDVDIDSNLKEEFLQMSLHIYPSYLRSIEYHAESMREKNEYFQSLYYYCKVLLNSQIKNKYQNYKNKVKTLYNDIQKEYELWNMKFLNNPFFEVVKSTDILISDLLIFKYKYRYYGVLLQGDDKRINMVGNSISVLNVGTFSENHYNEYTKIIMNEIILTFCLINLKIIYMDKVNMIDNLICDLDMILENYAELNLILKLINYIPCLTTIMLSTLEYVIFSSNTLICYMITLINMFTNHIVKFIIHYSSKCCNEDALNPFFEYLCIVLKCMEMVCRKEEYSNIYKEYFLKYSQFYFIELYNFLNKYTFDNNLDEEYLPIHREIGNSSFTKYSDWNDTCFFDDKMDFSKYILYLQNIINNLVYNNYIFFTREHDELIFNKTQFSLYFGSNTIFEKLLNLFHRSEHDYHFLLSLSIKIKDEHAHTIHLNIIQYIVPDTNTFLVSKRSIIHSKLFQKLNFAIPLVVMRELKNIDEKNNEKTMIVENAKKALEYIYSLVANDSDNIRMLTQKGELVKLLTTNITTSRDIVCKIDDIILDSVLALFNKYPFYNNDPFNKIRYSPILFITDDSVLSAKFQACFVKTLGIDIFHRIETLFHKFVYS